MTRKEEIMWNDYGKWIIEYLDVKLVDVCPINDVYDGKMYEILHNMDYYWTENIPLDENRVGDGLYLRDIFLDQTYKTEKAIPYIFRDKNCSVLEMLAGFAIRIDNEYLGSPSNPNADLIFDDMLDNLGIHWRDENEGFIQMAIQCWLDRKFAPNGHGSIFPLRNPTCDQRKIEMWSQMLAYISENYS